MNSKLWSIGLLSMVVWCELAGTAQAARRHYEEPDPLSLEDQAKEDHAPVPETPTHINLNSSARYMPAQVLPQARPQAQEMRDPPARLAQENDYQQEEAPVRLRGGPPDDAPPPPRPREDAYVPPPVQAPVAPQARQVDPMNAFAAQVLMEAMSTAGSEPEGGLASDWISHGRTQRPTYYRWQEEQPLFPMHEDDVTHTWVPAN